MCVKDAEQVSQEMEDLDDSNNKKTWPLLCGGDFFCTQMENWDDKDSPVAMVSGSSRVSIQTSFPVTIFFFLCEEKVAIDDTVSYNSVLGTCLLVKFCFKLRNLLL